MKRLVLVTAIGAILTGCGTTSNIHERRAEEYRKHKQEIAQKQVDEAPDWFRKDLPQSKDVIYAVSDAPGGSQSEAIENARNLANGTICSTAGGEVRSQSKSFTSSTEKSSTYLHTKAVKTACRGVDSTGFSLEKHKVIALDGRFHAFVMVALPLGDANTLAVTKENNRRARLAAGQAKDEFRELDAQKPKSE